jgi:predicted outer membrane repeat protein
MKKLFLLSFILLGHLSYAQQVIYVKKTSTGANNGSSWANAYTDLYTALAAATTGTEIWVAANTYYPDNGSDRTKNFTLKNGVSILGGFAGTETLNSQRNWTTNETILSGEIGNASLQTDNSDHVVYSSGNNATSIIDGFTIMAGYTNTASMSFGGGIYIENGSPIVRNCNFKNNMSTQWAGAAFIMNSNSLIEGCTFQENTGNIYGAALYLYQGSLTIKNSTFLNNTCPSSDCQGGAIYNYYGNLRIENSTFKSNTSTSFGGAIRNGFGTMTIINTHFQSNTASSEGGAIYSYAGTPNYIGCTFYYNTSGKGGAITHNSVGLSKVSNCTFYNNSASTGGGLYNNNGGSRVTNCIFWKNNDLNGEILSSQITDQNGTSSLIKNSIVEGISTSANNNINSDPLFVSPITYDYHLQASSPALNAGVSDTTGLSLPVTDRDGNPRIQNSIVDIGAYEGSVVTALSSASKNRFYTCYFSDNSIHISFKHEGFYRVVLYDISGKELHQEEFAGETLTLPVPYSASQLYLLKVLDINLADIAVDKVLIP